LSALTSRSILSASSLLLTLLTGCGDGLVGADYRGEVLAEMSGYVHVQYWNPNLPPVWEEEASRLRIAMFWGGPGGGIHEEQQVQAETEFPAKYTLKFYSPPPAESFQEAEGLVGRVAIGMPMLYIDLNDDGSWDHQKEPLVGSPYDTVMVYSEDGFEAYEEGRKIEWIDGEPVREFTPVSMSPGFHLMNGYVDLCQTALWPMAELREKRVDIVVDTFWDDLIDYDCDGALDEWMTVACPEDMSDLCEDPEALAEGSWEEGCLELCD